MGKQVSPLTHETHDESVVIGTYDRVDSDHGGKEKTLKEKTLSQIVCEEKIARKPHK
jgi:hypothetical protein